MIRTLIRLLLLVLAVTAIPISTTLAAFGKPSLNETPGEAGTWGFRPAESESVPMTPPSFSWRPQEEALSYSLQASRTAGFEEVAYEAEDMEYNVHMPTRTFEAGKWFWRFRFTTQAGQTSDWSRVRSFTVPAEAVEFPWPPKDQLLARIPTSHPRLFLRPEQVPDLRTLAQGRLKHLYEGLVLHCEGLLKNPPPTDEPPTYPSDVDRKSEQWREIWWGNRVRTIETLNGAATLAFTYLLGGDERFGRLAREILLAAAEWDPKGATGYRYNDEAGMPYNYYFSRTYTFVNDLLSDEDRRKCQQVMRIRGQEMYDHLRPKHLWRPYASHSNRAWHFLGEIGIAFYGEIEEAPEWVWFAANVFANVYPVWSDSDGGWHEGLSYWKSYLERFSWWADIMREALGIDAFRKPYFSKAGYFPLYLQPPGTKAGGFGDLAFDRDSTLTLPLVAHLATQARNPYWQWFVETQNFRPSQEGYIGFLREAQGTVQAKPPSDLPTSRLFQGVGLAALNSNLLDGTENIEILFKSSPFGTQSHGFESQNAFQLYAFGEPLLIRTGRRDIYASAHHKDWMWSTRSVNSITVNGEGQLSHTPEAVGRISRFHTGGNLDFVEGEAGAAYGSKLDRFTRSILFVKPNLILIIDRLWSPQPSTFEWLLHAPTEMKLLEGNQVQVENGQAAARVSFILPQRLDLQQTDQFDPPPRPRIQLRQFHLTASTQERAREVVFVTAIQPYRLGGSVPDALDASLVPGGLEIKGPWSKGTAAVRISTELKGTSRPGQSELEVVLKDAGGKVVESFSQGN